MPSLYDLLQVSTPEEVLDALVADFRSKGFPVASWQSGSVLRHVTEAEALFLASMSADIRNVGAGGIMVTAVERELDAWVDLLAENVYGETRRAAIATVGTVRVTDAGGVGPITLNAGTYWVSRADGSIRYRNTTTAVLPLNGTVDIPVRAEVAGAGYNLAPDTLSLLNPTIAGVQVSNPANITTGTWITTFGADADSNKQLADRCLAKWGAFRGSTAEAYRYWALAADQSVTRVRVLSPEAGTVNVWFAGVSGAVTAPVAAIVTAALAANKPLGVRVNAIAARNRTVPVIGVIYTRAGGDKVAALASAQSGIDAYARRLDMGETVYVSELTGAAVADRDVVNATMLMADTPLLADEVFVPNYANLSVQ